MYGRQKPLLYTLLLKAYRSIRQWTVKTQLTNNRFSHSCMIYHGIKISWHMRYLLNSNYMSRSCYVKMCIILFDRICYLLGRSSEQKEEIKIYHCLWKCNYQLSWIKSIKWWQRNILCTIWRILDSKWSIYIYNSSYHGIFQLIPWSSLLLAYGSWIYNYICNSVYHN
jgi:hypothetical protein